MVSTRRSFVAEFEQNYMRNETRSVFFPNRGEIGDWLLEVQSTLYNNKKIMSDDQFDADSVEE